MKKIQVSLLVLAGVLLYVSGLAIAGPLGAGLDASNNVEVTGDDADWSAVGAAYGVVAAQTGNNAAGSSVTTTGPLGDATLAGTATVTVPDGTRKMSVSLLSTGAGGTGSYTFVHDTSGIGVNTPGLGLQFLSNNNQGSVTSTGQIGNFTLDMPIGTTFRAINYTVMASGTQGNLAVVPDVL